MDMMDMMNGMGDGNGDDFDFKKKILDMMVQMMMEADMKDKHEAMSMPEIISMGEEMPVDMPGEDKMSMENMPSIMDKMEGMDDGETMGEEMAYDDEAETDENGKPRGMKRRPLF